MFYFILDGDSSFSLPLSNSKVGMRPKETETRGFQHTEHAVLSMQLAVLALSLAPYFLLPALPVREKPSWSSKLDVDVLKLKAHMC